MSQSDYIRIKRTQTELQDNQLPPILNSQNYTLYKEISVSNQVANTKTITRQLTPSNTTIIYDIAYKTMTNCPNNYPICQSTNLRSNRVLNLNVMMGDKPFIRQPAKFNKDMFFNICCL